MTVLLARNRQPPPAVAAGVSHADFAAELISLPSGLLAMVCEAIVKLKVSLGATCVRECERAFRVHGRRPDACTAPVRALGQGSPVEVAGAVCGVLAVLLVVPCWILFRLRMWSRE